ncbi:MAG: SAM-dependent DNA methyltransferase [Bacteroidales bacterium]|nr:SAM-dependent DNA methyltransferase [Bacteroidales bacterium]
MESKSIDQATKQLIDALKQTCGAFGLGNDGNEYKIIVQVFLYKYFNDKFGYEAKKTPGYGERLKKAEKWDEEYDKFTDDEIEDLFTFLPSNTPKMRPEHTIAHLYNAQGQGDFSNLFDSTMVSIAYLNADIFSMATVNKTKLTIFEPITIFIPDSSQRDEFAISLMRYIANPETNFEQMFSEKYDFFSTMFEYLIKDYNKDGGGKYAEYYTPRSIAQIMARLLVGNDKDSLRGVTCCDPSAGSGTLLMALAHEIGEDRCTIYSQDISQKSSKMLRLNLILNNLVSSIQNIIQGNTLLHPGHKEADGSLKKFDYIVSNPPFKLDFPDERDAIAADTIRFWAGVPNKPKEIDPDKPKMEIYLCFIQHVLYSLKGKGKGAIVVPTGFITGKTGIKKKIIEKLVDDHIIYGVVQMPSRIFATTGTNVSVLFFDKSGQQDKVVLIDASRMGHDEKDGNNLRTFLDQKEINTIVDTFSKRTSINGFSVVVSHQDVRDNGYSLNAGQYFDVNIEYVDITQNEFAQRMIEYKRQFQSMIKDDKAYKEQLIFQLDKIIFNEYPVSE